MYDKWLKKVLNLEDFVITPLPGDASFRTYYRVATPKSYILMVAPPTQVEISNFFPIAKALAACGVHTPYVYAYDAQQGLALLEDFGDQLLLDAITMENVDNLYQAAITTLHNIQQCAPEFALPKFDQDYMLTELMLCKTWFLEGYLQCTLSVAENTLITTTFDWLIKQIATQPQVFIHRDYHSRNLMILANDPIKLGVIDFQDGMLGPWAYDLVSLLKDCYITWPRAKVLELVKYFYDRLTNKFGRTLEEFIQDFDTCGLQRHIKVLGIFSRLHLRDKKSRYLDDLPRTLNYVTQYSALKEFTNFMQSLKLPWTN